MSFLASVSVRSYEVFRGKTRPTIPEDTTTIKINKLILLPCHMRNKISHCKQHFQYDLGWYGNGLKGGNRNMRSRVRGLPLQSKSDEIIAMTVWFIVPNFVFGQGATFVDHSKLDFVATNLVPPISCCDSTQLWCVMAVFVSKKRPRQCAR